MTLERQREIERGLLQQLALGTELVRRDRFELGAERGVEDLRVARGGFTGLGGQRMLAGEQRDRGAGKDQAGLAEKEAPGSDRVGHLQERHGNLQCRGGDS